VSHVGEARPSKGEAGRRPLEGRLDKGDGRGGLRSATVRTRDFPLVTDRPDIWPRLSSGVWNARSIPVEQYLFQRHGTSARYRYGTDGLSLAGIHQNRPV
jgi:hypothetical protein